ncbi:hypothetical protein TD95_000424 [Thielaviopsis punctulata]|uniref:Trafficking protein particle complex subunit 11 domain-containing protein n=1 Tax=Thielaviopsis punctulata TaxID=72032 RepID=A0A0F4ZIZ2_9PEZI|nr:hypothetical protein TD95_000424 [Thielaviopsis punctulata]
MEAYPEGSLAHNAPLLLVSGLSSAAKTVDLKLESSIESTAITIQSEYPPVETPVAQQLQNYLSSIDATQPPWDGDYKDAPYRFRVVTTGRTIKLPPRKAMLPADFEPSSPAPPVVHSPFSPLSTTSQLYPDGIINVDWLHKHQDLIPSVVLCFYVLTTDPTQAQESDVRLQNDILNIRTALSKSGHRTRLVVVLLNDDQATPTSPVENIADRLEMIRRNSGLDNKAIFYVAPKESVTELNVAADKILLALYPAAVDYYRELSRRARRKRSRGLTPNPTVPPTSGTSQILSLSHWHVRYDFKIAVFAEFRQDMDNACKFYDAAYQTLTSQEIWEMIPEWEPRWNEARMLADITAIRWIRCLLWNGHPSGAVRRWQMHYDLTEYMVEKHGRGTKNYGWEAWQARWYLVMAQLIENMSLPEMPPFQQTVFLPPEKTSTPEAFRPWDCLHHTGYWYRAAARHQAARRRLAYAIPEEDRKKPEDPLEASKSKDYSYDTYLCPEAYEEYSLSGPSTNHGQLIVECLEKALQPFLDRNQHRAVADITLECAKELTALGQADKAVDMLFPLWEEAEFRKHSWLDIAEEICWSLRRAAVKANRGDVVLGVDWELMSNKFSRRPQWPYDITKSLENMTISTKPQVELTEEKITPFISAVFLFRHKEARAGETCYAELQITTQTFNDAAAFQLSELHIQFEGGIGPIKIVHDEATASKAKTAGKTTVLSVDLEEEATAEDEDDVAPALFGSACLTFKPAHTTVLYFPIPLREPGETLAEGIKMVMNNDAFELSYVTGFQEVRALHSWYDPTTLRKTTIARDAPHTLDIQPRPPKMELSLVTPLQQYYTDEPLEFEMDVVNAEDEDITAKVDVLAAGKDIPGFSLKFGEESASSEVAEGGTSLSNFHLGKISKAEKTTMYLVLEPFSVPTACEVFVRVSYHLESDSATPIIQNTSFKIHPKTTFEARYELLPRLHPDPWPSMFGTAGLCDLGPEKPQGLAQKWSLECNYRSLAKDAFVIQNVDIEVLSLGDGAKCTPTLKTTLPDGGIATKIEDVQRASFDLDVQKVSLDDRTPALLDLVFRVHWTRKTTLPSKTGLASPNISSIAIPQYVVLGSEPRVLASLSHPANMPKGLLCMDVTIENASSHFLTFGLTIEPSDQFAFSGAKLTTVNVLPVSRRTVQFRLFPLVTGTYIRPALVVKDKYYQKILRIIPTEGMSADKDGLLIWVPQVDDEKP